MKTHLISTVVICLFLISCGIEEIPTYKLELTVSQSEGGKLNVSPILPMYPEGSKVTITPEPNEHWVFKQWEGDVSGGSTPLQLIMDSNKSVVGVFVKREYPLKITITGEGTVEEKIVTNPGGREYPFGTTVELTPIPKGGWVFDSWGGDLSGNESPKKISVDKDKNVIVKFIKKEKFPFRYQYLPFNGITKEGMLNWEGEMFDYDNDGFADMVSTGTQIMVVSNIFRDAYNPYTLTKTINLSDFIDFDKENLWSAMGVVHDFNKDGKMDHFVTLVGEGPAKDGSGIVYNRGQAFILMSEGNSFKGSMVDDRMMFRFDDTSVAFDYNRDGMMDVLCDFEFTIYQQNSNGTFQIIDNPFPRLTKNPGWLQTRISDLNNDGYEDIIGIAFNGLEIHFGTSDYKKFNSWYKEWDSLKDWFGADVTISNIDGIGHEEILVTYSDFKGNLKTRIFKFNGSDYLMDENDEFHGLTKSPSWDMETKTSAFDFDGDGDEDIFFQQINDFTNYFFENVNGKLIKRDF